MPVGRISSTGLYCKRLQSVWAIERGCPPTTEGDKQRAAVGSRARQTRPAGRYYLGGRCNTCRTPSDTVGRHDGEPLGGAELLAYGNPAAWWEYIRRLLDQRTGHGGRPVMQPGRRRWSGDTSPAPRRTGGGCLDRRRLPATGSRGSRPPAVAGAPSSRPPPRCPPRQAACPPGLPRPAPHGSASPVTFCRREGSAVRGHLCAVTS